MPTISSLFLNSVNSSVTGGIFLGNASVPQIVGGGTATVAKPVTIPLGTAPGLYFVLAQADAGQTLLETDDDHNLGTSVARLIVGPDLTVSAATAAAGVATGMNLSVSYTLKNAGGEAATNFEVGFTLVPVSPTGVPTGGPEVTLGPNRVVASLGAGAMQAFTNLLLIPADTVAGNFKIRVIADVTTAVIEASEGNNELLTGIVKVARPDLTVPSVTFTPAVAASGGTINVTHVVKNITAVNGNAPASQSAIYLSQNASFEGVLSQLATVSVPPLAAGGMTTLTRTVNVGNLSTGRYFVVVRADDPGTLIEQDDLSNNVGVSATALLVGPDPALTALSAAPAGVVPGANVSVTRTFANLGAAATGAFDVDYVLRPINPAGADVTLLRVNEPSLGPLGTVGATRSGTVALTIPSGTAPGQYAIRAVLDPDGTLVEADEGNNARTSNTFSVLLPDLVMSVFTPPATLIAGRSASLTNTVKNNTAPPATTGPFQVGIYFSTDATIDTLSDTLVGNRSVASLAGSGTSSVPVVITVPSVMGDFFLGAVVDHLNTVVEANESNNVTIKPVAVVPDLTAGRITPVAADISFNINGSPPTCLLTVIGSGTTSLKITTQTGGSFSGGQLQFADSVNGGAINTVNFSGTVSPTGDVTTGSFTLSRAGGGGGSGSGSLTGTASLGSPGALTLQLVGNFTVAGGGTCSLTATVTFVGSGPLTNVSVVPASLTAGDTGNVTIGFTTSDPWPGDGMLEITFPAGFAPSGANFVSATGPSGSLSLFSLVGQTYRFERTGGALFPPGPASITFSGITNPQGAGTTGTFLLTTTTRSLRPIDSGTAPAVTITPGALPGSPSVTPTSLVTGASGRVIVSLDTGHNLPGDGTLRITFPAGFEVSGASFVSAFNPPGDFAISVSGQMVTLTRSGGAVFAGQVFLTLNGIRNPAVTGTTGTFSVETTVAGGATIDTGTAPGVLISPPGALVNPAVSLGSLVAGAITTADVIFSTTNAWPGDGKMTVEFPTDFDVSGAAFVNQSGPDGFFDVVVSGQVVTIRRSVGFGFTGSGFITLFGIRNPAATGPTGSFPVATTTFAGDPIDSGTAPGVTITP